MHKDANAIGAVAPVSAHIVIVTSYPFPATEAAASGSAHGQAGVWIGRGGSGSHFGSPVLIGTMAH